MSTVLQSIFQDIANSIRSKTGSTDLISPVNMASAIDNIESGSSGSEPTNVFKIFNYTETYNPSYVPDSTYDITVRLVNTLDNQDLANILTELSGTNDYVYGQTYQKIHQYTGNSFDPVKRDRSINRERISDVWISDNVTNLSHAFENCINLNGNMNIMNLITNNTTDLSYMMANANQPGNNSFYDFTVPESVTNIDGMFYHADKNTFGTFTVGNNITSLSNLFAGAGTISLNLIAGDNIRDVSYMFAGRNVYGLNMYNIFNFNIDKLENISGMFCGASSITSSITLLNSNIKDASYVFKDALLNTIPIKVFSANNADGFYMNTNYNLYSNTTTNINFIVNSAAYMFYNYSETYNYRIYHNVYINITNPNGINSLAYCFENAYFGRNANITTSKSKNMSHAFSNCRTLYRLNIESEDNYTEDFSFAYYNLTANCLYGDILIPYGVKNAAYALYMAKYTNQTSYPSIAMSDTLVNISHMLDGCRLMPEFLYSFNNFNLKNVIDASYAFGVGYTIGRDNNFYINLKNIFGDSLRNMEGLFCNSRINATITGIELPDFIDTMAYMFANSSFSFSSGEINIPNSIKNLEGIFKESTPININIQAPSTVKSISYLKYKSSSDIIINGDNILYFNNLYYRALNCYNINNQYNDIQIHNVILNCNYVSNMSNLIYYNCLFNNTSVHYLNIDNLVLPKEIRNVENAFYGCNLNIRNISNISNGYNIFGKTIFRIDTTNEVDKCSYISNINNVDYFLSKEIPRYMNTPYYNAYLYSLTEISYINLDNVYYDGIHNCKNLFIANRNSYGYDTNYNISFRSSTGTNLYINNIVNTKDMFSGIVINPSYYCTSLNIIINNINNSTIFNSTYLDHTYDSYYNRYNYISINIGENVSYNTVLFNNFSFYKIQSLTISPNAILKIGTGVGFNYYYNSGSSTSQISHIDNLIIDHYGMYNPPTSGYTIFQNIDTSNLLNVYERPYQDNQKKRIRNITIKNLSNTTIFGQEQNKTFCLDLSNNYYSSELVFQNVYNINLGLNLYYSNHNINIVMDNVKANNIFGFNYYEYYNANANLSIINTPDYAYEQLFTYFNCKYLYVNFYDNCRSIRGIFKNMQAYHINNTILPNTQDMYGNYSGRYIFENFYSNYRSNFFLDENVTKLSHVFSNNITNIYLNMSNKITDLHYYIKNGSSSLYFPVFDNLNSASYLLYDYNSMTYAASISLNSISNINSLTHLVDNISINNLTIGLYQNINNLSYIVSNSYINTVNLYIYKNVNNMTNLFDNSNIKNLYLFNSILNDKDDLSYAFCKTNVIYQYNNATITNINNMSHIFDSGSYNYNNCISINGVNNASYAFNNAKIYLYSGQDTYSYAIYINNINNMAHMFDSSRMIRYNNMVLHTYINNSNITDMSYAFNNIYGLNSGPYLNYMYIYFNNCDVYNMSHAFNSGAPLYNLYIYNYPNTVIDLSYAFKASSNISINSQYYNYMYPNRFQQNIITENLINIAGLFSLGCFTSGQNWDDMTLSSNIVNVQNLFANCIYFNKNINITATNIDDTSYMYYNCIRFNQSVTINGNIGNAASMFGNCIDFNQSVTINGNIGNAAGMFDNCTNFNQPIDFIQNVYNSTAFMFKNTKFNYPVTLSNSVKNAASMFDNCITFNQPITLPDTLCNAAGMFYNDYMLKQTIILPNTLTDITNMFYNCTNVTVIGDVQINSQFSSAFYNVKSLQINANIDDINFINSTNLYNNFKLKRLHINYINNYYNSANIFTNLNVEDLYISNYYNGFIDYANCTNSLHIENIIANNTVYKSWIARGFNAINANIYINNCTILGNTYGFCTGTYFNSNVFIKDCIDISGNGALLRGITLNNSNLSIINSTGMNELLGGQNNQNINTLYIEGDRINLSNLFYNNSFSRYYSYNIGKAIINGMIENATSAFYNCGYTSSDPLYLNFVNNVIVGGMFSTNYEKPLNCPIYINVENNGYIGINSFIYNRNFNQPFVLNGIATNISHMITSSKFNQPLNINCINNIDASGMLDQCSYFNQPINISGTISNANSMFRGTSYNQPLDNIRFSYSFTAAYMFSQSAFNQPIENIPFNHISNAAYMFSSCYKFDQEVDLSSIGGSINTCYMFNGCTNLNKQILLGKGTNLYSMFNGCTNLNQKIDITFGAKDIRYMFTSCPSMNQSGNFIIPSSVVYANSFANSYLTKFGDNIIIECFDMIQDVKNTSNNSIRMIYRSTASPEMNIIFKKYYSSIDPNNVTNVSARLNRIIGNQSTYTTISIPNDNIAAAYRADQANVNFYFWK